MTNIESRPALAAHTPGPWSVTNGDSCLFVYDKDGTEIASVGDAPYWKRFTDEHEANARLITAAPDMLAALRVIVGIYDKDDDPNKGMKFSDRLKMVRAAIAKAVGDRSEVQQGSGGLNLTAASKG